MDQLARPERFQILVAEEGSQFIGWVEVALRDYAEGCQTSPVGYLEGWYVVPWPLYTSDAADELHCVDLRGRRNIKK